MPARAPDLRTPGVASTTVTGVRRGSGRMARAATVAVLLAALCPDPATAQVLSPGKLAEPHAELEGIRNCTRCHQLRQPGISRDLCLECHVPLATRIGDDRGFHATLAEPDCAACHKEHLGETYEMIRFDSAGFDHRRSGFVLDGAHADTGCRTCHAPVAVADPVVRKRKGERGALDRTWLGLPTACADCHGTDDPHGRQFESRGCSDCHDTDSFGEAPGFDHDLSRYRLTGRHRFVDCAGCHRQEPEPPVPRVVRFRPVAHGTCATCHADPHAGAMSGRCETCHDTSGWTRVRPAAVEGRFDHGSTGFSLEGSHAVAACETCHDARVVAGLEMVDLRFAAGSEDRPFPRPVLEGCGGCHVDPHAGAFDDVAGPGACEDCHGQDAWLPAAWDIERHNRQSAFALEGAHLVVPCGACHRDPRGELVLRPAASSCSSCHADAEPHAGQFEDRSCSDCHSVGSYRIPRFDHEGTRFPLEGAHADLPCASCHQAEENGAGGSVVRYVPLPTRCSDCHGGGVP